LQKIYFYYHCIYMNINKKLDNLLRKQGYQKIPLVTYRSGHIVFDLVLNDYPALFLLDTGASGTILTNDSIEKFSLEMQDTEESGTGAGSTGLKLQQAVGNKLAFGDKIIADMDLFVMDLTHVNNSFVELKHQTIDGVLGADILINYDCVLDYKGMNFYIKL
ncbi:MAG: retropepsin-like aspartic protease, partial [Chitinophagales bacterium]